MSNLSVFDKSLALSLWQSSERFPININNAWHWLGYASKRNCVDTLKNNFIANEDFMRGSAKSTNGRPSEVLLLSIECFKMLGMLAGTEQGKVIRKYFLECERVAKAVATERQSQLSSITQSRFNELIAIESALQQEVKDLEILLNKKRLELQEISNTLVNEAKAYRDANPKLIQQAITVIKVLNKAKANNRYLSV